MRSCSNERYTFHTEMQEVIEVEVEKEVLVGTTDHTQLTNRDAADQHPISAVTNLETQLSKMNQELSQKMGAQSAMSNMDIYNIIGGL